MHSCRQKSDIHVFVLSCLVGILPNTPSGVKRSGLGAHACWVFIDVSNCVIIHVSNWVISHVSKAFQYLIVRWKYENV